MAAAAESLDQVTQAMAMKPESSVPAPHSLACAAPAEGVTQSRMVLDYLGRRFSIGPKHLAAPAPTDADLLQAACVALRAPDHGGLNPFRFVKIGTHQRERLGTLFAQDAARRGHGAEEVERASQRAHNGPVLLALVGRLRPDDHVPEHEQWLCIGAALMNFLNALHLMGFGAKTLSGESLRDPDIQAAFCREGETLLAWIVAGTPTRSAHAKKADDATNVLADWTA